MRYLKHILVYLLLLTPFAYAQTPSQYNGVQQSTLGTGVGAALGQAVTGSGGIVAQTSPTIRVSLGFLNAGTSSTDALMAVAGGGMSGKQRYHLCLERV